MYFNFDIYFLFCNENVTTINSDYREDYYVLYLKKVKIDWWIEAWMIGSLQTILQQQIALKSSQIKLSCSQANLLQA